MKIIACDQLGPLWWEKRCGVPTASEFKRIITAKDAKGSKGMIGYAAELAADLQCQSPAYFTQKNRPINRYTEYGRNLEEEAANWYAFDRGVEIERVGFITSDDGRFGCSPDFLVKGDPYQGGGEIKCVEAHKHAKFVLKGELPLEYKAQVHGCLAVTGLPFWDWISYCPPMTPVVVRVTPSDFTTALQVQMEVFWETYQAVKAKLGIGNKESAVTDQEQIDSWRTKLATNPELFLMNEWLPDLSKIDDKPTRGACWNLCKAYAAKHGWAFDMETRSFKEPAPAA